MSDNEASQTARHRRMPRRGWRIVTWSLIGLVLAGLAWAGTTFYSTYRQADGEPTSVIVATWMRDNHMGPLVAQLENVYYRYVDKAQVGGQPTLSADISAEDGSGADIDADRTVVTTNVAAAITSEPVLLVPDRIPTATAPAAPAPATSTRQHLDPPPPIVSPATTPEPKEGQWQAVGSYVDGIPAIYVTRVRADDVHTSYYATAMWIDSSLTTAMYVPGYQEPGGPNPYDGALPKSLWPDVLANVNGAFRLDDTMGGYYYDGTMVRPLVDGRATTVTYRDGSIRIGKWGRDLKMSKDVTAVRQNLNLIVDGGRSKVTNGSDNVVWGATTDKESLAWRAAIGQLDDGSIVYVLGPHLSADGLADVLVRAGAQRAMVLDMNDWWTAGFYFRHKKDGTPLCRKLDPTIVDGCDRFLKTYKRDSFQFLAAPMPRTSPGYSPASSSKP